MCIRDSLYVFSAHLHMDEETPHLHIDFVPYITGSKRGLDTRAVSYTHLPLLSKKVDKWDENQFKTWCDYHYSVCREQSILGASNHVVIIGKK